MKKIKGFMVVGMFAHVAGAAGDFTASEHLEFLLKAEEKWAGGKYTDDVKVYADVAVTQLNRQTARFEELSDSRKDNSVNLTWIKSCGLETSAADLDADVCEISADELESDAQTYEYTLGQKVGFSVDAEKIRTNIYELEEQIAHGILRCDKLLSEWWAKQLLVSYDSFQGPNIPVIQGGKIPNFTWNGTDGWAEIAAGNYNVEIVAALIKMMQLNKINNGFFVEDGGLFIPWKNAGLDSGNLDGKGNDMRTMQIDLNFDMWNFSPAGISQNMFLLDRNAVAMKTYNRYPTAPQVLTGKINQTRYAYPSKILPGVMYDVVYEMACGTNGSPMHKWQFFTKGGIWLNPTACPIAVGEAEYTPTGVYGFKVTA